MCIYITISNHVGLEFLFTFQIIVIDRPIRCGNGNGGPRLRNVCCGSRTDAVPAAVVPSAGPSFPAAEQGISDVNITK